MRRLRRMLQDMFNAVREEQSPFQTHARVLRKMLRRVRDGLRKVIKG